jgi:D-3-phosphoglycerate dehydrogenase
MRVLAVGDSFMGVDVFERALAQLSDHHHVRYEQIDAARTLDPSTPSELAIDEFEGHPEQLVDLVGDAEALVVHGAPVTAAVLDAGPRLRLVGCARGGPVNVDVAAASERGIPVVRTPGKNAEAVADLTLAFLVMLARGIAGSQRFLLDGGHLGESTFEGARFLGHDLRGHVLGLVGYGAVGRRVAKRATAFGVDVIVHDPYVAADALAGEVLAEDLAVLLASADFVSLHARATPETGGMIDADALATMRAGSYLVNTARDALVVEPALYAALQSGHIAGAALDVVTPASNDKRNRLLDLPTVVVTPHIGGATHETLAQGAEMMRQEIERAAAGEPLLHVVDAAVRTVR